jgi:hypothetical protein
MRPSAAVFVCALVAAAPLAAQTDQDSLKADRAKHVADVREAIKGRENLPGDSVFKNLKMFGGMPADRLLRIMESGWSTALGVSCDHCHVIGEWDKEDKKPKQVARDMSAMSRTINADLRKIPNLQSATPTVNCTTCHRGAVKPATNLEAPRAP